MPWNDISPLQYLTTCAHALKLALSPASDCCTPFYTTLQTECWFFLLDHKRHSAAVFQGKGGGLPLFVMRRVRLREQNIQ